MKCSAVVFGLVVSVFTHSVFAQPLLDCPLADMPFSVDSPLSDVLANQQAKALLNDVAPAMVSMMGKSPAEGGLPPGFTNIISARIAFSMGPKSLADEQINAVDKQLGDLPITRADKQQRCARYDNERPNLARKLGKPAVLVFQKITGFRDVPSVDAAQALLKALADKNGWDMVFVEQAGVFNLEDLTRFDTVIWNNVSGDALTLTQRQAFKVYVESGGAFVGFHGSNGDPVSFWDWYSDELVGAKFIGHPFKPQYQEAKVIVEQPNSAMTAGFESEYVFSEEWYSFDRSVRDKGFDIWLSLDESTYEPIGFGGKDIRMHDHPLAWSHCVGQGRSFYTALGHRPEVYALPLTINLLENAIKWSMQENACK